MNEVSIIVVTYNAPGSLKSCLRSVLRHTKEPFNVIVMDNGPRGRLRKLRPLFERDPRITFESLSRNVGKSAAVNRAAAKLRSEWCVVLDDDAVVSPGWLSGLLAAARRAGPKTGVVGCKIVGADGLLDAAEMIFWQSTLGYQERDLGQRDYERLCDGICGACMLIRRELFDSIGFHEPLRQHFDDGDFCLQARRAGWSVFYCGSVAVTHEHLDRGVAAERPETRKLMERRWGIPAFKDSHPIDRLYASIWRAHAREDWRRVAEACRRLKLIDSTPAYALFSLGTALLHLRRPGQAAQALRAAAREEYVSESFRGKIDLALSLALHRNRTAVPVRETRIRS